MQNSIPLDKITHNPWQTRRGEPDAEYIRELADDIARNTMLQTPMGRALIDGQPVVVNEATIESKAGLVIELAFGHNRLAAYRQNFTERGAGWGRMPVEIRKLTDEQMAVLAWSENEKRRDHTPYERALAIRQRIEDFGWSQAQVGEHLGISRPAVSNALRLLDLPEDVLAAIGSGQISERVAMALVSLLDLPDSLREAAERHYQLQPSKIIQEALSGSLTSDMIRKKLDEICSYYGKKLESAEWPLDQVFSMENDNILAATCRDCELRFKDRNLCLAPNCFGYKTITNRGIYLEKASQSCGYPPLEVEKNSYGATTEFLWSSKEKHLPAIQQAGCPNLRVMYDTNVRSGVTADKAGYAPGFPQAKIVCNKREQFCTCLAGLNALAEQHRMAAGKDDGRLAETIEELYSSELPGEPEIQAETPSSAAFAPDAEELKVLARGAQKEKRDAKQQAHFIMDEAAQRIAVGLNQRNPDTWIAFMRSSEYNRSNWKSRDLWDIFLALATDLAAKKMPYEVKSLRQVTEDMNRLLKDCGLELIEPPVEEVVVEAPVVVAEGRPLVEVFGEAEAQ